MLTDSGCLLKPVHKSLQSKLSDSISSTAKVTEVSAFISLERYQNLVHLGSGWLHNALGIAPSYSLKHQIGTLLITTWLNFLYKARVCKNPFFFFLLFRRTAKSVCFCLVYNLCWCELLPLASQTPRAVLKVLLCTAMLRTAALLATQQQEPKCPSWTGAFPAPILLSFSPSACHIYQLQALCKRIPVCKTSVTFLRILFISFRKFKKIEVKSMLFLYCFKAYFSEKKRHTLPELINNSVPDMLQDALSMTAEHFALDP